MDKEEFNANMLSGQNVDKYFDTETVQRMTVKANNFARHHETANFVASYTPNDLFAARSEEQDIEALQYLIDIKTDSSHYQDVQNELGFVEQYEKSYDSINDFKDYLHNTRRIDAQGDIFGSGVQLTDELVETLALRVVNAFDTPDENGHLTGFGETTGDRDSIRVMHLQQYFAEPNTNVNFDDVRDIVKELYSIETGWGEGITSINGERLSNFNTRTFEDTKWTPNSRESYAIYLLRQSELSSENGIVLTKERIGQEKDDLLKTKRDLIDGLSQSIGDFDRHRASIRDNILIDNFVSLQNKLNGDDYIVYDEENPFAELGMDSIDSQDLQKRVGYGEAQELFDRSKTVNDNKEMIAQKFREFPPKVSDTMVRAAAYQAIFNQDNLYHECNAYENLLKRQAKDHEDYKKLSDKLFSLKEQLHDIKTIGKQTRLADSIDENHLQKVRDILSNIELDTESRNYINNLGLESVIVSRKNLSMISCGV